MTAKPNPVVGHLNLCSEIKRGLAASASILAMSLMAQPAYAQIVADDEDTVVVTGSRQVIQGAIALKRNDTQIVDGLSADEIGDIPALSIGEALESLTGVSSHRENGGATEISIRGLGPFLSTTVFNGREATNGSGNRAVNFSQFPAELMSKAAVYKTQNASLIEGAVAGQVLLETLRPLDHNKQRIQFEIKGNVNPDQLNIDDSEAGDIGFRGSVSYVDQYELGGGAELGISIGAELSRISQPEQEIRSTSPQSSSNLACLVNPANVLQGFTNNQDISEDDCEDNAGSRTVAPDGTVFDPSRVDGYNTSLFSGAAVDSGEGFAFVGSQSGFRANDTEDKRDALFGALQFQPNDRLDINLDVQWSERTQQEDRNDIVFDNRRRNSSDGVTIGGVTQTTLDSLVVNPTGEIQSIWQESDISIAGELYERKEKYLGGGLAVDYDLTNSLTASADVSYSKTERTELQTSWRIQTARRINANYSVQESGFPQYTLGFTDEGDVFDINDASGFLDNPRLRIDNDLDRKDEILAGRLDFNYKLNDGSFIDSVDVGGRWSERKFYDLTSSAGGTGTGDHRLTLEPGDAASADIVADCAVDFPESDFLTGIYDNNNIFTTLGADGEQAVDGDGNAFGTGNTFAALDNNCLNESILTFFDLEGSNLSNIDFPELAVGITTTDVTEETLAGYIQANFDTTFDGLPLSGNFGVRVVNTDTTSIGYRAKQNTEDNGDGTFSVSTDSSTLVADEVSTSYTEILPSLNVNLEVHDDIIVRGAVFRGISRFRPIDLNNRRTLNLENDDGGDGFTTVEELFASATAFGTPQAKPFTSWNYDAAVEWYPNPDTILAVGAYGKRFTGGVETLQTTEDFVIDGVPTTLPINIQQINDDKSTLFGVEASIAHRFSYLPGYLSGFGVKAGYNYAESDFEFEDQRYGDAGIIDEDGNFVQTAQGIVAPAGLPGLSEHVFSGQVYYQIGGFDISGIYKYRDDYFQPYTGNPNVLRFTQGRGLFEARASYKINDNFTVKVEALNLLNKERVDTFRTKDNFGQASSYGPRIFFGLRGRF